MRALIVEADSLFASRLNDALSTVGFDVVGRARSSGEAFLLAQSNQPDVVILSIDLEARGVGHRLAGRLEQELSVPTVVANKSTGVLEESACSDLASLALQRRRKRA